MIRIYKFRGIQSSCYSNIIIIMNIKLDYKNKLHSIGKDIKSLDQIAKAIRLRYPDEFQHGVVCALIDNGNLVQVKNFQQIISFWNKNGAGASVKIKVFEAPKNPENKEQAKQGMLWSAEPIYTQSVYETSEIRLPQQSDVFEVTQEVQIPQQKTCNPFRKTQKIEQPPMENKQLKNIQTQSEIHKIEESKQKQIQKVQKQIAQQQNSQTILKPDTPLFKSIIQIVEERVRSILKQYHLIPKISQKHSQKVEEIQKQEKQQQKLPPVKSILGEIEKDLQKAIDIKIQPLQSVQVPKEYKAKFTHPPQNIVRALASANYTWKVSFTNSGVSPWPSSVAVYKTSNKMLQIIDVKSIGPGESTEIVISMIAPSSKGSQSKEFRLGYIDQETDSLTFFGPKFGFKLETANEQKPTVNQREQQEDSELMKSVVMAAKHVSNQKHSIRSLTRSIKALGIDCNVSQQILIDIIIQLQTEKLN